MLRFEWFNEVSREWLSLCLLSCNSSALIAWFCLEGTFTRWCVYVSFPLWRNKLFMFLTRSSSFTDCLVKGLSAQSLGEQREGEAGAAWRSSCKGLSWHVTGVLNLLWVGVRKYFVQIVGIYQFPDTAGVKTDASFNDWVCAKQIGRERGTGCLSGLNHHLTLFHEEAAEEKKNGTNMEFSWRDPWLWPPGVTDR